MTTRMRKIVKIDEEKCNGCGLCVPSCAEGAIRIIDGKARLVAENLCDGLGNCLGECPQGAITIEQRPAEAFDEQAVERHLAGAGKPAPPEAKPPALVPKSGTPAGKPAGGCPGTLLRKLQGNRAEPASGQTGSAPQRASALQQWPVQLALLPPRGDIWNGADVLLAADCVAVAVPDFHERLLAGRTVAVACPKLDDALGYVDKLAEVFAGNDVRHVTIAHMEVPCCAGLKRIVGMALQQAGVDIPVETVEIGLDGSVLGTEKPLARGA